MSNFRCLYVLLAITLSNIAWAGTCDTRSLKAIELKFSRSRSATHYLTQKTSIEILIKMELIKKLQERLHTIEEGEDSSANRLQKNHYERSLKTLASFENMKATLSHRERGADKEKDPFRLVYKITKDGELPDWQAGSMIDLSLMFCEDDLSSLEETLNISFHDIMPGLDFIKIRSSKSKRPLFYQENANGLNTNDWEWARKATGFDKISFYKPKEDRSVKMAMLDTGLLCHPDFCSDESEVESIMDIPGLKRSNFGHGTRVYGLLKGNRLGLVPNVEVTNYRVSKQVLALGAEVSRAIESSLDIVERKDFDIVTISLGGPSFKKRAALNSLNQLYRDGVIVTSAAGNKIPFVVAPANLSTVIGVTACDLHHNAWDGSGHGPKAEICAPGVLVWHPRPKFYPAELREVGMKAVTFDFIQGSGTSLATPFVAAAAALWLEKHGKQTLLKLYSKPCKIVEAFRKNLGDSSDRVQRGKGRRYYGKGFLNVANLLEAKLPKDSELKCVL